jgi:hypothetical protein
MISFRPTMWLRVLTVLVILFPMIAFGQAVTATVSGTVKDSTGLVLPGVQVVLLNEDTGATRTVQSDTAGRYVAASLTLGNYKVTSTLQGFQTTVRSGIVLTVGREAVVDLEMTVGAVTQTVEVSAEAAAIETTNATISGFVTQEQIRELPLNGRSLTDLALMSPGVFYNRTVGNSPQDGMGPRISINGGRQESNLYLMDGTVVTNRTGGTSGVTGATLGVEAVREFRILTHNYGAEYGQSAGGVMSFVTRSGTNQFHGSLYEFLRNNVLDARDFFNNTNKKPPFRRNQFGGALGGPIKKDRLFFFVNLEYLRQSETSSSFTTVPDANARKGFLPCSVAPTTPCNTATGLANVGVSPLITPYFNALNLWPLPNDRSFGDGTGVAIVNQSAPNNENYSMYRADYRISDKDTVYVRYVRDPSDRLRLRPMPTFASKDEAENHYAAINETHVFSGTALNEFRAAFNRNFAYVDTTALTAYDPALDYNPGQGFGHIRFQQTNTFSGALTAVGAPSGVKTTIVGNLFQVSNMFSWVKGAHSLKFGVTVQRYQANNNSLTLTRGEFFFDSLQDLMAARPSRLDGAHIDNKFGMRGLRNTLYGWFIQDDYKVSPKLTLNLGLRHEFLTDPTEVNGRNGNLRPYTAAEPVIGPIANFAKWNFAPRVGLAWDPTGSGKNAVRLGVGVYHNQIFNPANSDPFQPGNFSVTFSATNPSTFPRFPANPPLSARSQSTNQWPIDTPTVLQFSLDLQRQLTSSLSARVGYVGSSSYNLTRSVQQNIRIPSIVNGQNFWSSTNLPRYNQGYSFISSLQADTVANYNALQVSLNQAFHAGLMFGATYTWGRAMSEADAAQNEIVRNGGSFTSYDRDYPGRDYSRSSYDQRHTFVLNSQYDLPFERVLHLNNGVGKTLAGGWAIKGIWQYGSGMPLTATAGFNVSRNGQNNAADRVDVTPGFSQNPTFGTTRGCTVGGVTIPAGQPLRTPDRWFDPCAFSLPAAGFLGTIGRNTMDGPNFNQASFTLQKNTRIRESVNLEIRAELFNLFNHPSFGLPQIAIFGSTRAIVGNAGVIAETTSRSRQIQLGMRLTF